MIFIINDALTVFWYCPVIVNACDEMCLYIAVSCGI